jgi:uncharacterized membrane protein YphA (DoxX/SURF4 family)
MQGRTSDDSAGYRPAFRQPAQQAQSCVVTTMHIDPSLILAGRVLGALVFGSAVAGKLRYRAQFTGVVANYRLVPEPLAMPVARAVIVCELLVCVSLVTGWQLENGAALAVFLLACFTAAMGINLARGRTEIDCGCFQSVLRQRLSPALLLRNLLFIAVLAAPLAARSEVSAGASVAASALQSIDGLAAGATAFVLYLVWGQLLSIRDAAQALRKRSI